jgi:hypothetical protein
LIAAFDVNSEEFFLQEMKGAAFDVALLQSSVADEGRVAGAGKCDKIFDSYLFVSADADEIVDRYSVFFGFVMVASKNYLH